METRATSLDPLWDRAEEWDRRLRMVAEARRFLYVSTYYLEHDDYGVAFLTALDEARQRGVAVNLLIDGFGQQLGGVLMSAEVKRTLADRLDALRAAGAVVTVYRPAHAIQRWVGGGHHVKIQVSEAGEAIFGSSNVTASSYAHWNEFSVALRGPVVRVLLESYREIGGVVDDAHLRELDEVANTGDDGGAEGVALDYWLCNPNHDQGWLGPIGWRGDNEVTDRMVEMLDAARERVRLTAFYFKPVPRLMRAVEAAARRGVQVEVYHSHLDALEATDLAWFAAATSYDRLLDAGVRIIESRRGEHSKIVLVDDAWVAFGSYNFEDAAHDRLAEAMLATRDPRMVRHAVSIFDALPDDPDQVVVTTQFRLELSAVMRLRLALMGRFKRWM